MRSIPMKGQILVKLKILNNEGWKSRQPIRDDALIMERLLNQKKYFLFLIVTSTLFITYLHYSTLPLIHDLHNIFTELYYLPLLLGALAFGLKGAVLTFIFVSVLYVPYILVNWTNTFPFVANKLLHALFSGLFVTITALSETT
jgi:hypothetical protein